MKNINSISLILNNHNKTMNDYLQIILSAIMGGAGYKFLALAYTSKFKSKDLQMELIGELREEVRELRDRIDKVQKELDFCKRDFYELTEKYLGIVRD